MLRILFFLLLFLPSLTRAECTGPGFETMMSAGELAELDAKIAATPYAEGLFWRARKADTEIRLIGTMHLADPRHDALLARAAPWISEADLLLVEAGPEELARLEKATMTDPDRLFNSSGPTLPELLDAQSWKMVREAAFARGVPSPLAAKMRPWFLTLTLSIPACAIPSLAAGEPGLDQMLMDAAQEADVPVAALEPWDTLFTIFAGNPLEEQLLALRSAAMAPELADAGFASLLRDYFAERPGAVWSMSEIMARHAPGFTPEEAARAMAQMEQDLLISRNEAWLPRITDAAARGSVLVAAGAAHLPGEHGLLRLLEKEGWTLSRD